MHESTLSALWRFQWRNCLTASQLRAVCGISSSTRWDSILDIPRIISEKFLQQTGWSLPGKEEEFVLCFGGQPFFWLSGRFRYCPICLEAGYHSIWYQLLLLNQCPLHDCNLTVICQSCGATTDLYNSQLFLGKPYFCRRCQDPIAGVEPLISTHRLFRLHLFEIAARFDSYLDWLCSNEGIAIIDKVKPDSSFAVGWSNWCKSQRFAQDLAWCFSPFPPLELEPPLYRSFTIIKWNFEIRYLQEPLSYRRTRPWREQIQTGHAAYRCTIRRLYRWIGKQKCENVLAQIGDKINNKGDVNITEFEPRAAALALMRIFVEQRGYYRKIEDAFVHPDFKFTMPAIEDRTFRLVWRAFFIAFFATCVACVNRARRTGILRLSEITPTQVPWHVNVDNRSASPESVYVSGITVFPTLRGLPIPFKSVSYIER